MCLQIKQELFPLLAERIAEECVAGKQIISTFGNRVQSSPQREDTSTIETCNHEDVAYIGSAHKMSSVSTRPCMGSMFTTRALTS